jgi:zinc D-Ala-D-Ala carboxypeptidase
MRLSEHFTLAEMTTTQQRGIDNTPGPVEIERLQELCRTILEPLRRSFGPIIITSGYRCPELNARIGGSKTSAHMLGLAADCHAWDPGVAIEDMARWLAASDLPFDQVIDERSGRSRWLHVGLPRPGHAPRRECLLYRDGVYSRADWGSHGSI